MTTEFLTRIHRLCILVLLLLISGCSEGPGQKPGRKFTIGFSQCVGSDQWRQSMLKEMQRELSFHPEITFLYEDADNSSSTQERQVRSLLERNIDLLIISPNEAHPLTPVVEETFKKGIPVVVIDRKTSSRLYTAYGGANNFEIGRLAGNYVGQLLGRRGRVAEVMGLPGSSPAIERQRGFLEALKAYPHIEVVKQVYGDWLIQKAEREAHKLSGDTIDAVFAHNDQMGLGSSRALNKAGTTRKVKIIGVDALPENGQKLVASGILTASMLYPTGGKEAIRTSLAILSKQPFQKENILQTFAVDSANVQLMQMQSDRIDQQQGDIEKQQLMLEEQNRVFRSQQTILNILVVSLVLALIFGGIAFIALNENWKNNKKLESKNAEILQQQQQLLEMSQRAQAATEAKFNFFTNISHEFRTPLTLILSPLEELSADQKQPPVVKDRLHLIGRNVKRLLKMVDELIDFRKIEYDGTKLRASRNNIVPFLSDITDSFRDAARKRSIDLRIDVPATEIELWYDPAMLEKVIFNLLSNALKFTSEGGRVALVVSLKKNEQLLEIRVDDNGMGMTEEEAAHAFDMFYQGSAAPQKGSGLGLTLSREIVRLHKGEIFLKSQIGAGTCFTIQLPLGDEHLSESEKISCHLQAKPSWYETGIVEAQQDIDEAEPSLTKEFSILVIEDHEDLLLYLQKTLSGSYDIYPARNGTEGIREALNKVPDLVISDIVLPEKSGIELAQLLKSDVRTSHIPIILLTARGSSEHMIEGINTMADAYLTKPFNLQQLKATIRNLLFNRNLLKARYTTALPEGRQLPGTNKIDKKFLNDFAAVVETNLANEKFGVEDICKSMGISRVQLYRKVKALLGCTITDYILSRRLKKADYLLLNEDLTIAEITFHVGFSSATYFSTVFKAHYQTTPSEYRKEKLSVRNINT